MYDLSSSCVCISHFGITIVSCTCRYGHHKQAAALRKQFSVPDKQWWWAKIRALSAARSWDGLDAFAAEKKSPIGYEPFLEVAKKFGAPREVQARYE